MTLGDRLLRLGFELAAAPLVVATARRVERRERALGLGALVDELRGDRRPLPRWLTRPEALAGAVERWLPWLPPRGDGICLRRALVLLALWSRCGLEATLHLGFRLDAPDRGGHAWLSARASDGRRLQSSGPLDTAPAFEL